MKISTFFLIWAGVSVRNIEEVGSLELIFVLAPWRAGKNVENIRDGFGQPSRGATSRVILKYGSWKSKKRFLEIINRITDFNLNLILNCNICMMGVPSTNYGLKQCDPPSPPIEVLARPWSIPNLIVFTLLPVFTVYLIYGTWNKTWDILSASKCVGKGVAEWRCSLNGRKSYFAYTWTVIKSKDGLNLVISHTSLNLDDILVKFWAAPES